MGNNKISVHLAKVISGGQTGVDRAGLDAAIQAGICIGGWCPKGRRAEDGEIPSQYPLIELKSSDYRRRTEKNILQSDATLILCFGDPTGGTRLTHQMTHQHNKPHRIVNLNDFTSQEDELVWLREKNIKILNIAGPREDPDRKIYTSARAYLDELFLQSVKRIKY